MFLNAVCIGNDFICKTTSIEKTALEYIEENYDGEECYIKNISCEGNYNVHIVSPTNEDIDFTLYITKQGEITLTEYW